MYVHLVCLGQILLFRFLCFAHKEEDKPSRCLVFKTPSVQDLFFLFKPEGSFQKRQILTLGWWQWDDGLSSLCSSPGMPVCSHLYLLLGDLDNHSVRQDPFLGLPDEVLAWLWCICLQHEDLHDGCFVSWRALEIDFRPESTEQVSAW